MYTFGFSWKIWESPKAIAPAEDILEYLNAAAKEQGIVDKIRFNTDLKEKSFIHNLQHMPAFDKN